MASQEIVPLVILFAITISCFVISIRSFQQKGFLFNNAYIYASKETRESMDKTKYYKQSGVIFALMGCLFLSAMVQIITNAEWAVGFIVFFIITIVIYAIVSTIKLY